MREILGDGAANSNVLPIAFMDEPFGRVWRSAVAWSTVKAFVGEKDTSGS